MQRRVEKALVAKVGTFVFAGILGLPATLPASGAPVSITADVTTRSGAVSALALFDVASELPEMRAAVRPSLAAERAATAEVAGNAAGSVATSASSTERPSATVVPAPVLAPGPATTARQPTGAAVLASWYGPGFYGETTACGITLTPQTLGVANLTLPCGTMLTLRSPAGRTITVPVIDRGPFIAGRTLDLTYATTVALGCSDLCSVQMTIAP